MNVEDIIDRLDVPSIHRAARWAARQLADTRHAVVVLQPGDMTRYEIVVIAADATQFVSSSGDEFDTDAVGHYIVTLCNDFGQSYPWGGHPVEANYVYAKWVREDRSVWSAVVLTVFLNELSKFLRRRA